MRFIRFFGLVSVLVLSAGLPSAASSQDLRAADLRVNMQIRVQQSGGEAGSGLFLGILGDTLFYESANVSGSSLTHSVIKLPIAAISRLYVHVGPRPPIAHERCAGVLS